MNLSDTPNPSAKKLVISHNNKVGEYLDINNTSAESIEYSILSIVGIESVFAGPGFLTILKKENSDWETISEEINTIFDKL
mgnify:CR=1 FL=1|tara:strand:+ start:8433 stop:8675 length:243 start_codon:yes stop_codon:yes gene_type:complete